MGLSGKRKKEIRRQRGHDGPTTVERRKAWAKPHVRQICTPETRGKTYETKETTAEGPGS